MPNGRDEEHGAPRWRLRATRYLARQAALPIFGAALFAYLRFPYWSIVVLAACFAALYFWLNRRALGVTRLVAFANESMPPAYVVIAFILLGLSIGVGFLAIQTAVYAGMRWLVG